MPGAPARGGGHLSIWDLERTALEALDISPFTERDEVIKSDPASSTISATSPGQNPIFLDESAEDTELHGSWALLHQQINDLQTGVRSFAARHAYSTYVRQSSQSPDNQQFIGRRRIEKTRMPGRKVEILQIDNVGNAKVVRKTSPARRQALSQRSLSPQLGPRSLSPRPPLRGATQKPSPSPKLASRHPVSITELCAAQKKASNSSFRQDERMERSLSPMPEHRSPLPAHSLASSTQFAESVTLRPRGVERSLSPMRSRQHGGYSRQYSFAPTAPTLVITPGLSSMPYNTFAPVFPFYKEP